MTLRTSRIFWIILPGSRTKSKNSRSERRTTREERRRTNSTKSANSKKNSNIKSVRNSGRKQIKKESSEINKEK
jgi:hypothetical protein